MGRVGRPGRLVGPASLTHRHCPPSRPGHRGDHLQLRQRLAARPGTPQGLPIPAGHPLLGVRRGLPLGYPSLDPRRARWRQRHPRRRHRPPSRVLHPDRTIVRPGPHLSPPTHGACHPRPARGRGSTNSCTTSDKKGSSRAKQPPSGRRPQPERRARRDVPPVRPGRDSP